MTASACRSGCMTPQVRSPARHSDAARLAQTRQPCRMAAALALAAARSGVDGRESIESKEHMLARLGVTWGRRGIPGRTPEALASSAWPSRAPADRSGKLARSRGALERCECEINLALRKRRLGFSWQALR